MRFSGLSIFVSVVVFCFYIFSLYLWYSARPGGSIFVSLGPYAVQGSAIALIIRKIGLRSIFLVIPCVVVCFAVIAAFVHLISGYFYVAIDWPGARNFPLVFFVQLVISVIIALSVWIVFFVVNNISSRINVALKMLRRN